MMYEEGKWFLLSTGIWIPDVLSKDCLNSFPFVAGVGTHVIEVADYFLCHWTVEGCSSLLTDFDFITEDLFLWSWTKV